MGPAQADPQLDALADSQAKAASSRRAGAPLNGQILHGETMKPGGTQEFRVQLDAEHCYWFGGATNEMGQRITLTVSDPHGAEVASEKGKATDAILEYCPVTDGIFKLESKLGHHGPFSVAVYQGTRLAAAVPPTGVSPRRSSRRRQRPRRPARARSARSTRAPPRRRAGRPRSPRAAATGSSARAPRAR